MVPQIHEDILMSLKGLTAESFANEAGRVQMRNALSSALRRVQSPWDVVMDHVWTQPAETAAIRALIDAGFWQRWNQRGGHASTVMNFANLTGMDPIFLRRLLRMLAGQHFLREVDQDTYEGTPYSRALGSDGYPSAYTFLSELTGPCFANFPLWAANTGYTSKTDLAHNNFHSWYSQGNAQDMFQMFAEDKPQATLHFAKTMQLYSSVKVPWTEIYPTEMLLSSQKDRTPLLVDVGGNIGHDVEKFLAKHPGVSPELLVVQDKPEVIARIKTPNDAYVAQGYDFFTPQPIKGARVYYLHNILHDWPDVQAVEILRIVVASMDKGYSKILLHEGSIAPRQAHPRMTISDLSMLMALGAEERTEQQWRSLVEQAGLGVVKIWKTDEAVESIFELEKLSS